MMMMVVVVVRSGAVIMEDRAESHIVGEAGSVQQHRGFQGMSLVIWGKVTD